MAGGPTDSRRVAAIVLACGKPRYARACLRSLVAHAGVPLELVMVENGAAPEVRAALDEAGRQAARGGHVVKRLRFEENVGAVRGRNEALRLVEAEYVAWLDSDCLARTRRWLLRLSSRLDAEAPAARSQCERVRKSPGPNGPGCDARGAGGELGIVAPKLVYPWRPYDIQCAGCDVTRSGRVVFRGRGRRRDDPEFGSPRDCACLISACWVMRTRLFSELGPLDEAFSPVQFEDIDFCYRARAAGWRVAYEPSVEMYHFEGMTTTRTAGLDYNRLTARNAVRFKRKWREVIEREGGVPEREARWLRDVGWRPIEELDEAGELELVD